MNGISIIVPVYNVAKFLPRCLDSLVSQTMESIEIILVDDGSTDSSGDICEKYAAQDMRIKVIHQENGGLSAARNTGLKNAVGKYILFVDSDDYIRTDSCKLLFDCAEKFGADIVAADVKRLVGTREESELIRNLPTETVFSGEEFLLISFEKGTCVFPAPFALYRTELITENALFFKQGIYHEDELWTPQVYLAAQKAVYLPLDFYYYYCREGSISKSDCSSYKKRCEDLLETCSVLHSRYETVSPELKDKLNDYLTTVYLVAVFMGRKTDGDKRFLKENASSAKNRLKALLYSLSPALYLRLLCFVKKQPYKI